jgi:hypothetical protein
MSTVLGPTGTFTAPAAGPVSLTATASFAGIGSFGVPTGPTGAASFAAHGVLQIEASLLTDQTDTSLQYTGVPRFGELILRLFIQPEHQEERLARYEDVFNVWTRKHGARKARLFYYRWALQSIIDILTIGGIGAFIDWIYDRFSGK